jgi:type I restriction enzyme S subunit
LKGSRKTTENVYLNLIEGRFPRKGDLIYSRNASLGFAAYVDTDEKFCMGQDVCLISSTQQNQLFLMYQLNCPVVLSQLDIEMKGSTISRINVRQIIQLIIVCPPPVEQLEIAISLDQKTAHIDTLIERVLYSINLLKEYRTALISAAVTGKIDVRDEVKA